MEDLFSTSFRCRRSSSKNREPNDGNRGNNDSIPRWCNSNTINQNVGEIHAQSLRKEKTNEEEAKKEKGTYCKAEEAPTSSSESHSKKDER